MEKTGKQAYIQMFLEKKNMTWEQCSKNQKKVFNDWPPEMWEIYDWEFLSNKKYENNVDSK